MTEPDLVLGPFEQIRRAPSGTPASELRARARAYADLAACARTRTYKRGEIAARHGDVADHICVVQSGEMSIYVGDWSGDRTQLRVCGPGSAWGEVGLANVVLAPPGHGNERRPLRSANVRANNEVTARIILYSQVNALRKRHLQIDAIIVQLLAGLVVKLTRDLREREARLPGPVRLRACLMNLLLEQQSTDGWLTVTQTEMANRLRLGRPHVNRLLKGERDAQRIETSGGSARLRVDMGRMEAQARLDRAEYPPAL